MLNRMEGNDTHLNDIPDFPRELGLDKWTLDTLRDRMVMIAQFEPWRSTFDELLYEAFNPITVPQVVRDYWDDEMRDYADGCNRRATAARAAIMAYLNRIETKPEPKVA